MNSRHQQVHVELGALGFRTLGDRLELVLDPDHTLVIQLGDFSERPLELELETLCEGEQIDSAVVRLGAIPKYISDAVEQLGPMPVTF